MEIIQNIRIAQISLPFLLIKQCLPELSLPTRSIHKHSSGRFSIIFQGIQFKYNYFTLKSMGACLSETSRPNTQAIKQANKTNNNTHQERSQQASNSIATNNQVHPPMPKVILRPVFPKELRQPTSNLTLQGQIKPIANEFIEVKVPKDVAAWTDFQWIKEPHYFIPDAIANFSAVDIKGRSFQQKLKWFRLKLEKKRISWTEGKSEYLEVDRENILMSSNSQFQRINFYKEVKIIFKDEKETSDAGGLLRQWMSLCIKEIFSPELGLMKLCESPETYYKFNCNQFAMDLFQVAARILGIVIGKAIFQRIPVECHLNYAILRQLCGQPIHMQDIYTYDRDFYNGWKFMIENSMTTMLQQNFCVYQFDQHGTQNTVELKPNGFNIMVNSTNKEEYITLMAEYYCTKSVSKLMENLKYGLYKIIPLELIQVFLPHELDVMLNGRKSINVQDLKQNTVYTDCTVSDQVIVWFWQFASSLSQEKLTGLLHFVTGNGRVPILGFKYLQSNRGEYQKFHIKMVPYDHIDPYPKSHTCFNRLELPRYPSFSIFQKYIEYVTVEMIHFGLQ